MSLNIHICVCVCVWKLWMAHEGIMTDFHANRECFPPSPSLSINAIFMASSRRELLKGAP